MSSRYAVVLKPEMTLPEKDSFIAQAWGEVPISHIQDDEDFNRCSFIDLKVNKWEVNPRWSGLQESEPWVRVDILKGQALGEYVRTHIHPLSFKVDCVTVVTLELDEGGGYVDDILLLRLVSVICAGCQVYRWDEGFQEVGEVDIVASLPSLKEIGEMLNRCELS